MIHLATTGYTGALCGRSLGPGDQLTASPPRTGCTWCLSAYMSGLSTSTCVAIPYDPALYVGTVHHLEPGANEPLCCDVSNAFFLYAVEPHMVSCHDCLRRLKKVAQPIPIDPRCRCPMLTGGGIDHADGCGRQ